jgi:hypothetical protein
MIRRGGVITLIFVLALAIGASAESPRQADIDACDKEAAAAAPLPAASPDVGKPSTSADPRASTKTEDGASGTQTTVKGPQAATTPAERQAFAACLARHGYYKGYYH